MDIYKKFIIDFEHNLNNIKDKKEFSNFVIVCIGTDKITGDSLGPLVGYRLNKLFNQNKKVKVLGNFNNIINAQNIDVLNFEYKETCIIAIDAALSSKNNIGEIIVDTTKIELGAGLYKNIGHIGDISIKGVVAENKYKIDYNLKNLQNARLRISSGYGR